MRLADDLSDTLEELSAEAEHELATNPPLLLSAICVLNRYRFEEVLSLYDLDQHELQRLFVQLDRLGIIELLADNRYRMRLSRSFRWRKGGEIESYFVNSIFRVFRQATDSRQQPLPFCLGHSNAGKRPAISPATAHAL